MRLILIKQIKRGKYLKQSRKELISCKNVKKKKIEKEFVKNRLRQRNFIKNKKQR